MLLDFNRPGRMSECEHWDRVHNTFHSIKIAYGERVSYVSLSSCQCVHKWHLLAAGYNANDMWSVIVLRLDGNLREVIKRVNDGLFISCFS